jgi:hypothetical protein
MIYRPKGPVYGVPDWMNELIFKGSKKQVERRMMKIYGL